MTLTVDQIRLLKKVIEEEVAIQYGAISNYINEQVSLGFVTRRLELSDYEETLLRIIITGNETGKLPSEQLRDKIIVERFTTNQTVDLKRNNAGSIVLKIDTNPNLVIKTEVDKIKLSKLRYVFNLNFSELLNSRSSLEDLIALLKQEISDLKSKLRQSENQNENLRIAISELESQIKELNTIISELETRIAELQTEITDISEAHRIEIQKLLEDAKLQLELVQKQKDEMEKQKNQEINEIKAKIDNFINLENLERDKIIVQDVYRYWVDVENEEVRLNKEQVKYNLADDLEYGAYIIDSLEPTVISDLTNSAIREAFNSDDFSATNARVSFSTRKVANDRYVVLNPENSAEPLFASVQVYLREGVFDEGNARLTNESILMIDLLKQNALSQQQTDRLLAFSKRKAPLLR